MNSITHAYSVVAFLLVLGCTLMGFPLSVFSEENTAVEPTEQTSPEIASSSQVIASTSRASGLDATIEKQTPSDVAVIGDPYPREKLSGDQVYHDFVVGPGRFVLEIAPGESKTVEMVVSNRMGEGKRFSLTTEDTSGSEDGSQAVVLLGNQRGPYTLKDYIKIPQSKFYLEQGERVRIPVTVTLPKDAEPGGFYGSILASIVSDPIPAGDTSGAKPGSVVISRIGTLFFVTTPGTIKEDGKLQKFSTLNDKHIYGSGPINFDVVSENFGSVHLAPYGEIKISNMIGSEVGSVTLEPWFVMPKSLRVREASWNRDFLIGRYTAVAKINRGYDNQVDELSYSFWVIPWKLLAGVFAGLFIFFLLLRFIFTRFEFKMKSK